MDSSLRAAVIARAGDRCEYCQRHQSTSPLIPLQIEHIIALKHGGLTVLENTALACAECNLYKGTNLAGIDPLTNELTRLFDPRRDRWEEHFAWNSLRIEGLTAVGRTTVRVLEMNSVARLQVRMANHTAREP